jgi:hypothetical protein
LAGSRAVSLITAAAAIADGTIDLHTPAADGTARRHACLLSAQRQSADFEV